MMYYETPDGQPTTRLQTMLPNIINPQFLTDTELAEHGIARCEVVHPQVEWWQQSGERVIDDTQTPHVITWAVVDRTLEDVKATAWERIKQTREEKRSGLMPYDYPGYGILHNEMSEKAVRDLSASTTAGVALAGMGVTDPAMPWTTHENTTVVLTPAQMVAFGLAAMQWHTALHMTSQTLRPLIADAETVADVVAVEWPEG